jgi:hypothetical protein
MPTARASIKTNKELFFPNSRGGQDKWFGIDSGNDSFE